MKRFIIAVVLCVLVFWVFDFDREHTFANDNIEIKNNYSVIFETESNWGTFEAVPYVYASGNDVTMKIYNPRSQIVFEGLAQDGKIFEDVLYLNAESGVWLFEFEAEEAKLTYDISLIEMYLKSIAMENELLYNLYRLLIAFIIVFLVIGYKPLKGLLKYKSVLDKEHDVDGFISISEELKKVGLQKRVKNTYSMNIASGHIYNGDYLKAKSILDDMPRDRSGEVKIIRKWVKFYYLNYIYLLLEMGDLEEASELMKRKKALLESKTPHPRDHFVLPYLKALMRVHNKEYYKAKDQLITLKNIAIKDQEKAGIRFLLAKIYYGLEDYITAKAYLDKAKETCHFKGLKKKIEDLEQML